MDHFQYIKEQVRHKLVRTKLSSKNVKDAASFILTLTEYAEKVAKFWFEIFESCDDPADRLSLLYVANEVLTKSNKYGAPEFRDIFKPFVQQAVQRIRVQGHLVSKLTKLFNYWTHYKVFDVKFVQQLLTRISPVAAANDPSSKMSEGLKSPELNEEERIKSFNPDKLIAALRRLEQMDSERDGETKPDIGQLCADLPMANVLASLKSRSECRAMTRQVDVCCKSLEVYMQKRREHLEHLTSVSRLIDAAVLFYDFQHKEVSVVINAYSAYGKRVGTTLGSAKTCLDPEKSAKNLRATRVEELVPTVKDDQGSNGGSSVGDADNLFDGDNSVDDSDEDISSVPEKFLRVMPVYQPSPIPPKEVQACAKGDQDVSATNIPSDDYDTWNKKTWVPSPFAADRTKLNLIQNESGDVDYRLLLNPAGPYSGNQSFQLQSTLMSGYQSAMDRDDRFPLATTIDHRIAAPVPFEQLTSDWLRPPCSAGEAADDPDEVASSMEMSDGDAPDLDELDDLVVLNEVTEAENGDPVSQEPVASSHAVVADQDWRLFPPAFGNPAVRSFGHVCPPLGNPLDHQAPPSPPTAVARPTPPLPVPRDVLCPVDPPPLRDGDTSAPASVQQPLGVGNFRLPPPPLPPVSLRFPHAPPPPNPPALLLQPPTAWLPGYATLPSGTNPAFPVAIEATLPSSTISIQEQRSPVHSVVQPTNPDDHCTANKPEPGRASCMPPSPPPSTVTLGLATGTTSPNPMTTLFSVLKSSINSQAAASANPHPPVNPVKEDDDPFAIISRLTGLSSLVKRLPVSSSTCSSSTTYQPPVPEPDVKRSAAGSVSSIPTPLVPSWSALLSTDTSGARECTANGPTVAIGDFLSNSGDIKRVEVDGDAGDADDDDDDDDDDDRLSGCSGETPTQDEHDDESGPARLDAGLSNQIERKGHGGGETLEQQNSRFSSVFDAAPGKVAGAVGAPAMMSDLILLTKPKYLGQQQGGHSIFPHNFPLVATTVSPALDLEQHLGKLGNERRRGSPELVPAQPNPILLPSLTGSPGGLRWTAMAGGNPGIFSQVSTSSAGGQLLTDSAVAEASLPLRRLSNLPASVLATCGNLGSASTGWSPASLATSLALAAAAGAPSCSRGELISSSSSSTPSSRAPIGQVFGGQMPTPSHHLPPAWRLPPPPMAQQPQTTVPIGFWLNQQQQHQQQRQQQQRQPMVVRHPRPSLFGPPPW